MPGSLILFPYLLVLGMIFLPGQSGNSVWKLGVVRKDRDE
jgi:hypothetical protein